jgi:hypothetical protein
LRLGPKTGLSVTPLKPNSGVFVLPSAIAPACRSRSTTGASSSGTKCSYNLDPHVVRTPLVMTRSLMDTGIPCSMPSGPPRITAASASRAEARAASPVTVQ